MTRSEKIRASRKRNTARRTQWCLRKIRKYQPKNLLETTKLGMICLYVGEGAFRLAYKIVGTTLLIKFPLTESFHKREPDGSFITCRTNDHDGKCHTRAEVRKIRVLSKFKSLRKILPPVYYYNSHDGVMVTRYYLKATVNDWTSQIGPLLSGVIKELTGVTLEDLFGDNVRKKSEDSLVIVDCGY